MEFDVISRGPGTKTKCDVRVMRGYDDIRSARALKFSVNACIRIKIKINLELA